MDHATGDTRGWESSIRKMNGDMLSVTQREKKPLILGQKVLVIMGLPGARCGRLRRHSRTRRLRRRVAGKESRSQARAAHQDRGGALCSRLGVPTAQSGERPGRRGAAAGETGERRHRFRNRHACRPHRRRVISNPLPLAVTTKQDEK